MPFRSLLRRTTEEELASAKRRTSPQGYMIKNYSIPIPKLDATKNGICALYAGPEHLNIQSQWTLTFLLYSRIKILGQHTLIERRL